MHRIFAHIDKDDLTLKLELDSKNITSCKLYTDLKSHIESNMFLAVRKAAAGGRKFIIYSIGDHLSKDDEQDIQKAEVFLDIEIVDTISPVTYNKLSQLTYWPVILKLKNGSKLLESLTIQVNKSDDFIKERKFSSFIE
jgi:hypothetical protein